MRYPQASRAEVLVFSAVADAAGLAAIALGLKTRHESKQFWEALFGRGASLPHISHLRLITTTLTLAALGLAAWWWVRMRPGLVGVWRRNAALLLAACAAVLTRLFPGAYDDAISFAPGATSPDPAIRPALTIAIAAGLAFFGIAACALALRLARDRTGHAAGGGSDRVS